MNFLRPRFRRLWPMLVAWAGLLARAADDPAVVALPPFMVEEATKGPPWRYVQSPDFEILSRCDDTTTRHLTETYFRLHRLLALVLPEGLQVRHSVAKTMIYYNEEMRPAASQEIIAQMLRGNAAIPPPDELPDLGGRGFRGGVPAPRRYTFMPNMRLWDKDAMAVFTIVRPGDYDTDTMYLTHDYVGYLVKNRTPTLPGWFTAGFMSLYPHIKFRRDSLLLERAVWISDAETRLVKSDPPKARPLLPVAAFFRGDASGNNQSKEENLKVWVSQAELLVRWGLEGTDGVRRAGFWKLVERSAAELPSEKLTEECLGLDYPALNGQLAAFLPTAVRKEATLRLESAVRLPPLAPRNATDGEIARIKGDWERLEIDYVRRRYPEMASKYIEQARRTLLRAYDRNDRDPRLLAILGLCECDAGNDAGAREYLEAAARLNVVRPRAWYELARLRYAERLAAPASEGRLSANQAVEVLTPLFTARRQAPPIPEVYELIADVWAHCAFAPTPAHLAVLTEGIGLFPRRVSLVLRAASLHLLGGHYEEAASFINLGLRLADNDTDRASFTALQERLPAAAAVK
ncbi:MAG: hypothetical protein NTV51_06315 [Verrucomicrobia bacterium]|nr:hypothetical protein [Verrucomicrobiota bacterium]